jgi:hypothetical protein
MLIFLIAIIYFCVGEFIIGNCKISSDANNPFITHFILPLIGTIFLLNILCVICLVFIPGFLSIRNWLYKGTFEPKIRGRSISEWIYKFRHGGFQ